MDYPQSDAPKWALPVWVFFQPTPKGYTDMFFFQLWNPFAGLFQGTLNGTSHLDGPPPFEKHPKCEFRCWLCTFETLSPVLFEVIPEEPRSLHVDTSATVSIGAADKPSCFPKRTWWLGIRVGHVLLKPAVDCQYLSLKGSSAEAVPLLAKQHKQLQETLAAVCGCLTNFL